MRLAFTILLALFVGALAFTRHAQAHGETELRIAAVTAALNSGSTNAAELYLQRGELHREHQQWDLAEADYQSAAHAGAEAEKIEVCRGWLLTDSGQLEVAENKFTEVLNRFSKDGDAFIGRARVEAKLGKNDAAIADFERGTALQSKPTPEDILTLARLHAQAERTDKALKTLDAGIIKVGPLLALETYALDLELRSTNAVAALARVDTIVEHAPRKELWLAKRGEILLQAHRLPEAQQSFIAALRAIDSLPPRLQQSPSMVQLQAHIRTAMAESKRAASATVVKAE